MRALDDRPRSQLALGNPADTGGPLVIHVLAKNKFRGVLSDRYLIPYAPWFVYTVGNTVSRIQSSST